MAGRTSTSTMPELESMFSSLSHHPQHTLEPDSTDPVPAFIDRRWRGHTEQSKKSVQQVAGISPDDQSWLNRKECHVTGADRWKFFKRPLTPFAQQFSPNEIFALPRLYFASTDGNNAFLQPTHFTVGVQTDYRDSETQTDPYSPQYVVQPGTTPSELLQLAALTWGRGLPAGLSEVERIRRARAKRAWEATLPSLDDLSQLDRRRRMMMEMEVKEWAFREAEIQKLQEARPAVLADLLRQRDEAQKEVTRERLDQIYSKLQKDRETKRRKIQHDYDRTLRKLEAKRGNVEGKLERPGIVRHCTDSSPYNRRSHSGTFTNKNTCSNELKGHYLDTYDDLIKLELKRPPTEVNYAISSPVVRAATLMEINKALNEEMDECVTKKPLRCLVKKEKPVARPVTPRVDEPPEGNEERELAVIHLQKLLRGRSVQYKMFKGKENHLELIQELRSVNALQKEEQELQNADRGLVVTLTQQRDKSMHKTSQEEASQARVVGAELEDMFDTLSKELTHLQEERRIHAFTLLAERNRRLREAEESGRRQVEERQCREEDEIFRQVVQVHQETVDLYLEDIILATFEHTSDQQAREEIRRRVKEVNDIVSATEKSRNDLQSEEIVSELVYSFLIPEIEKMRVREREHRRQHGHLQAAQSIIQETVEGSGTPPSTLALNQEQGEAGRRAAPHSE